MAEDTPAPADEKVEGTATFPLLTYLDGLMEDLRNRVPGALDVWEPAAIHQSRVATRRMKAALDLMEIVLSRRPRRKFGRVLRGLRRRLGPLRDADVMLDHLHELGADARFSAPAGWLSVRVSRERDKSRKASVRRRPPAGVIEKLAAWAPVREEVLVAREAVDSLLAESLHLQLDAFAEQADRLVGSATPSDAPPASPLPSSPASSDESGFDDVRQDPHELRISGKALRYTLEMAVVQGHDLPGSLTKTFKKMQDALGVWHDCVVLGDRATRAALDERLSHHEPGLMTEMLDLLREVLARGTRQLAKFKTLWNEEGDAVAKAIRKCFPLTHPRVASDAGAAGVTAPKTDPDPSGSESPADPGDAPPADSSGA